MAVAVVVGMGRMGPRYGPHPAASAAGRGPCDGIPSAAAGQRAYPRITGSPFAPGARGTGDGGCHGRLDRPDRQSGDRSASPQRRCRPRGAHISEREGRSRGSASPGCCGHGTLFGVFVTMRHGLGTWFVRAARGIRGWRAALLL